jgi:SAM-dependent methyltransferase
MKKNNWVKFWDKRKGSMSARVRRAFGKNFRTAYNIYLNHRIGTKVTSHTPPLTKMFLEVGCGRGTMSELFKRNGFDTIGVDIMENCARPFPGKFILGDGFKLPFKDQMFDFVLTYGLLEHFSYGDQIKLIVEINRVVKFDSLGIHYVVPRKLTNLFEDRSVYRSSCSKLINTLEPSWVYPVFGDGWWTNRFLGKAFWIYTKNCVGETNENSSVDNSEEPEHTGAKEELQMPWGNTPV